MYKRMRLFQNFSFWNSYLGFRACSETNRVLGQARLLKLFLIPLAALFMGACGLLVGTPFIEPVPQADVEQSMGNLATVDLRNYSPHPAFSHFAIFYRIYISDILEMAPQPVNFNAINPVLHTNFNQIYPFIDSDDHIGQNMHNVFTGMNFRYLALAGGYNIDEVLGNALFSRPLEERRLEFEFGTGQIPFMRIGSDVFSLWRAINHLGGTPHFTPYPDRFFRNTDDLRNTENLIADRNAPDVQDRAGIAAIDRNFTYVAMFIVAVGLDPATFSSVFSTPALIHVFQLPD